MTTSNINVFEVLDNFFGSQICPSVEQFSNRQIMELREHILRFYGASTVLPVAGKTRLFLGSFLSSPPFTIDSSPYISSALLYSDSLTLYDPLHHWFCEEQYKRERLTSAPTGWKDLRTGKPDYAKTRNYLLHTFSWLYALRPLIDAELLVLIPAEQIVFSNQAELRRLAKEIENLLEPTEQLGAEFSPNEITVDDNRRGLFAFAGGDRIAQIQRSIGRGIEQFAKDVIIANATGAIYTAPFRWEQHLCKMSFNEYGAIKYHTKSILSIKRGNHGAAQESPRCRACAV